MTCSRCKMTNPPPASEHWYHGERIDYRLGETIGEAARRHFARKAATPAPTKPVAPPAKPLTPAAALAEPPKRGRIKFATGSFNAFKRKAS